MRTVTFSEPAVVNYLNEHFVCAWVNKRPDVKFKDGPVKGSELARRNGTGSTNVTSLFAAADGTVLHAMPGYRDLDSFLEQASFARFVYDRMYDGAHVRRPHAEASYVSAHATAHQNVAELLEKRAHRHLSQKLVKLHEFPKEWFASVERPPLRKKKESP